MSDNPLQVAREHVAKGEEILALAEGQMEAATRSAAGPNRPLVVLTVAMASAHFSAAMAITSIEASVGH